MTCPVFNIPPTSDDNGLTAYTSDGSSTTYTIGFDYLDSQDKAPGEVSDYIRVYDYDNATVTEVSYTLSSETEIELDSPVTSGHTIYIVRKLNILEKEVAWSNESEIDEVNLDRMYDQLLQNDQDIWRRMTCLEETVSSLGADIGGVRDFRFSATPSQTAFTLTGQAGISESLIEVFDTTAGKTYEPNEYSVADSGANAIVTLTSGVTSGHIVFIKVWQAVLVAYTVGDGTISTSKIADGSITLVKINWDASGTNNQAFMKRSGSWTPSTILYTDIPSFNTGVRLNSLDQMTTPAANVPFNSKKITGLANGTTATQDSCTVAQMEAYVAAATASLSTSGIRHSRGTLSVSSTSYATVDLGFNYDVLILVMTNSDAESHYSAGADNYEYFGPRTAMHSSSLGTTATAYKVAYGATAFVGNWYEVTVQQISNGFQIKRSGTVSSTTVVQYLAITNFTG